MVRGGRAAAWVMAAALAAGALAGCSTAGHSAFGNNQLSVAEVADIDTYGPDAALRQARAHFRNQDFGHSAAFYRRVVELAPNKAEGYVGLGASYDQLGRFDLSDRVYASLFRLSGGTAQYYNNVGYSYMLRGNLGEAASNFRKAQRLDPDSDVIANNLALLQRAASA